jgi:hypothetical protein
MMTAYFSQAGEAPFTNGNLYEPVDYGTSVNGGWRLPMPASRKRLLTGLAAGVLLGLILLSGRNAD